MEAKEILKIAANALNEKKAVDLSAIRVGELTVIADYFLLATATSSTHVRALADEVEEKLGRAGVSPHHIEGKATGWILLDYSSVVVHIFSREAREFYNLDRMWNDGAAVDLTEFLETAQEASE